MNFFCVILLRVNINLMSKMNERF